MKTINSVGGIGDILFSEPIFRHFWEKDGVKPIVIIHTHQMWIQDYIESACFNEYSIAYNKFETGSMFHNEEFINLRYANQIYRGYGPDDHHDLENMMLDKYRLLRLQEDLWKKLDIKLQDGPNTLQCASAHPFCIVNERSQAGNILIDPKGFETGFIIKMYERSYTTLIDWWKTIREAKENHHVSTSTFFLMQAIKNTYPDWNAPCYIYPRPNVDGLRGISQLKPDFNLIRVGK